jgi:two-component system, LytTR family, response regulator
LKIRTLVVDDEVLGRKRIKKLLELQSDIEVVGEASNGVEALVLLEKTQPDLIFLDVQMPELNGFEMLAQVSPQDIPLTIFVTAYDQYALQAFNTSAIDYLLKPFDDDRFDGALARARTYLKGSSSKSFQSEIQGFLQSLSVSNHLSRIAIKDKDRIIFVRSSEIDWIEAIGNYLKIHVNKDGYMLRGRIAEIEKQLNPREFFRIHRSTIVNLDKVKELLPLCKGEAIALLHNGLRLNVSRHSLQELQKVLQPRL